MKEIHEGLGLEQTTQPGHACCGQRPEEWARFQPKDAGCEDLWRPACSAWSHHRALAGDQVLSGENVGLGRDYGLVKFEKLMPERKKVSVYANLVDMMENLDNKRVKQREPFREKREEKKALKLLSRHFGNVGFQLAPERT